MPTPDEHYTVTEHRTNQTMEAVTWLAQWWQAMTSDEVVRYIKLSSMP